MKQDEMLRTETETGSVDDIDANEDEATDQLGDTLADGLTKPSRRPPQTVVVANKRSAATGRVRMFGSIMDADKDDSLDLRSGLRAR